MSVGLLLITHGLIGHALIEAARNTLGERPIRIELLAISPEMTDTNELKNQATALYQQVDTGDGVIILTDLFGSTPANIASALLSLPRSLMITGVNLPMIIRLMNYADLPLEDLGEKGITGGHEGTFMMQEENDD